MCVSNIPTRGFDFPHLHNLKTSCNGRFLNCGDGTRQLLVLCGKSNQRSLIFSSEKIDELVPRAKLVTDKL